MKTTNPKAANKNSGGNLNAAQEKANQELEETLVSPDAHLDTVRDILFGAQIKETQKQRANMEKQLKELISSLQKDADEKFSSMQKDMELMRKEVDATAEKNVETFNKKLTELDKELTDSVQKLEKSTSESDADIADQLQTNVSSINQQMEKWKVDILSELDTAHSQLMNDKTDRETLSALFADISKQLVDGKKPA